MEPTRRYRNWGSPEFWRFLEVLFRFLAEIVKNT